MEPRALKSYPRAQTRTIGARKVRNAGRVPAVIYGPKVDSQAIEIDQKDLGAIIRNAVSQVILIDLEVEGDERPKRQALVKKVDRHVMRDEVIHLDLFEVEDTTVVELNIPVEPVGEPTGVKDAEGTLARLVANVKVRSTPAKAPEIIHTDISNMKVAETLHVRDLPEIDGVEYVSPDDLRIYTIIPPRVKKDAPGKADKKKK